MHSLLIVYAASEPAPQPGTPIWVSILVAVIAALGGGLGWNIYKRWRTGQSDDAIQVSNAALEQARGAKELFVEYRIELENAKTQVSKYLDELIEVNRLLGAANARISRLEADLQHAHQEQNELREQLQQARRDRDDAAKMRDRLIDQVTTMQNQIRKLEEAPTTLKNQPPL